MNYLAWRDITANVLRFVLAAAGVGFLLTGCMGIMGLYRGVLHDALMTIEDIGADLWVVQGGRAGPFADQTGGDGPRQAEKVLTHVPAPFVGFDRWNVEQARPNRRGRRIDDGFARHRSRFARRNQLVIDQQCDKGQKEQGMGAEGGGVNA